MRTPHLLSLRLAAAVLAVTLALAVPSRGEDLPQIRKNGVLRHLGIPYANFVTGGGDGLDVELIQAFAASLGLRYEYVKSDWDTALEDLLGRKVSLRGGTAELGGKAPIRGSLVANGFTILPWREKIADFSLPTFPSQIWLIARSDSKVKPIRPSGDIRKDIGMVKALMKGHRVLAMKKTCLDPDLYGLGDTGAEIACFPGRLNELAPAVLKGDAEMTILDAPDALIAMEKWGGKIKIIGPVSERQLMGVAFSQDAPLLRDAFNAFFKKTWRDGSYLRLVKKYYPTATAYFPDFFEK